MEFTLESLEIEMAREVIIRRERVKRLDGYWREDPPSERRAVGGRGPTEPGV